MEGSLMAFKVFTNGSTLQASEVNDNLMRQAVSTFTNAAARTAAIPSPNEGMVTYLEDIDALQMRVGSIWTNVANTGRGILSYQAATAGTAVSAGVALTLFTATVTILPGRLYEFFGTCAFQPNSNTAPVALFINTSGLSNRTLYYQTATIGANLNRTLQGSSIFTSSAMGVTSGTGTSKTFTLQLRAGSAGSLNADPDGYVGGGSSEQQFIIRDVGAN
jgi:hypothetical protein